MVNSEYSIQKEKEAEKLKGVEEEILDAIHFLKTNMPYPETGPYSTRGYGKDDRNDLLYEKERNSRYWEKINYYESVMDEPYFARMDFKVKERSETEYHTYYIAKQALDIDGKMIACDWRSPVGQTYYVKNQTNFSYGSYDYLLMLRRALKIRNGNLIDINDEYLYGADEVKNRITDPFLLRALQEKKDEFKLTDIIATIQDNQNDIISSPFQDDFIVQVLQTSNSVHELLKTFAKTCSPLLPCKV